MTSNSILNINLDDTHWVVQINELLDKDFQSIKNTPVCIFHVPDSITADKPEAYVPRLMALGPYHHLRPELYKMEIYKLDKAKKARERFQLHEFHDLVDSLKQQEHKIRACFDKYVEINCDGLAWIMVIDSLCLLWLLGISRDMVQMCFRRNNHVDPKEYLVIGNSLAQYEIIRDVLLLENQIPIVVLREILPINSELVSLLCNFCRSIFPFKLNICLEEYISYMETKLDESRHLMHLLYNLIWTAKRKPVLVLASANGHKHDTVGHVHNVSTVLNVLGSVLNIGFVQTLSEGISLIQTLLGLLIPDRKSSTAEDICRVVPSASELYKAGLKFEPKDGGIGVGIGEAEFDKAHATLILPVIAFNSFSEVLLRNLVAFELTAKLDSPILTLYIALMNGLLASAADVKILKEKEIINNSLSSDDDVVRIFNGIMKSTRSIIDTSQLLKPLDDQKTEPTLLRIADLDGSNGLTTQENSSDEIIKINDIKFETFFIPEYSDIHGEQITIIKGINQYHDSTWKIKAKKSLKKYLYPPVKILAVLVILCLIILVVIHTICGLFSCPRVLKK